MPVGRLARSLTLVGVLTMVSATVAQTEPVLSGTFVQLNNQLANLGEDGWLAELSYMQAVGMDTVIVQYSRYGGVSYFPAVDPGNDDTSESTEVLPPDESIATLRWVAPAELRARHLRVSVVPDSREWTMIPEIRVLNGEENIVAGRGYTVEPAPAGNYLDPEAGSGGKLTDGLANFAWSDMVGWQNPGKQITIEFDFDEPTEVDAVEVDFMRSDISNVDLPSSIAIAASGDGERFLSLGQPVVWSAGEQDQKVELDPLGDLLAAAETLDMKVWLGLSLDPTYWQGVFDPLASAETNIELMKELESRYGSSPALAGYYLPEEIDDRSFIEAKAHAAMVEYLASMAEAGHEIDRPVMVAPYFGMNPNADAYADWWDETLAAAPIDVIAMQDGVGTKRTTVEEGVPVYRALKEVTDRHDVALWSDLEVFEQVHGWPVDGLAWQAQSANINTVIEQLELEAPYVDKFVVFDFSHYMSPRLGGEALELYQGYQEYLEDRTP
ncbi:MAG TPA: DUF4434 domain-containing protein [Trueperaceae bacterium]